MSEPTITPETQATLELAKTNATVAWRLQMHTTIHGDDHVFVQDPDDIPGGCKTCWSNIDPNAIRSYD